MKQLMLDSLNNYRTSLMDNIKKTGNADESSAIQHKIRQLECLIPQYSKNTQTLSPRLSSNLREAIENCLAFDISVSNPIENTKTFISGNLDQSNLFILEPDDFPYVLRAQWGDTEGDVHCRDFTEESLTNAQRIAPGVWITQAINEPELTVPIIDTVQIRTFTTLANDLMIEPVATG